MAYLPQRVEVDAMALYTLKARKRLPAVRQVNHQHVVNDVDVEPFELQTHVGSNALHGAHHAARVGTALHEQASRAQQQAEPALYLSLAHHIHCMLSGCPRNAIIASLSSGRALMSR